MDDDDRPYALTLVAAEGFALTAAVVDRARARVFGAEPESLSAGRAVDIACEGAPRLDRVRAALGGAPVDALAVPAADRRKRLLVADMDGTIVREETLDELARRAGTGALVRAITVRSMNGEIDFATSLRARVETLRGLPLAALEETWRGITPSPGARALVATMRQAGAATALVSGGFTVFSNRVASLCGFDVHHANVLLDDGAALTGAVADPVLDPDGKRDILHRLAAEHGIAIADTLAIGDGANDIPMLLAAGIGVGIRPKAVVAEAVPNRIEHADLRALLYVQGYHDDEITDGAPAPG